MLERFSKNEDNARLPVRLGWSLFLVGALFLLQILLRESVAKSDFRYVWLAGKLWGGGVDPYGPQYTSLGASLFMPEWIGAPWFYPFHWYLFAVPIGAMPLKSAFHYWIFASTLGALSAALLAARTSRLEAHRFTWPVLTALLGWSLTTTIWGAALRTGQPAVIAVIGLPIIAWGVRRTNHLAIAIGATLILLKPQFGFPVCAALLFMPGALPGLIGGGVLTGLLSLPALAIGGGVATVGRLLASTHGDYASFSYNQPPNMTGLPHVVALMGGGYMPLLVSLGLAMMLSAGLALAWRLNAHHLSEDAPLFLLTVPPACIATLVSLHGYDPSLLFFALPFIARFKRSAMILIAAGFFFLWRSDNLARAIGGNVASLSTVGIALVAAGYVWGWCRNRRDDVTTAIHNGLLETNASAFSRVDAKQVY